MTLDLQSIRYAGSGEGPVIARKDPRKPDAVINGIRSAVERALPGADADPIHAEKARAPLPAFRDPRVSVADSKQQIIEALQEFDPALAKRAGAILNNRSRMTIRSVPPGQAMMMRVRPATLKLKPDDDMRLTEDNVGKERLQKLRKTFPRDDNPTSKVKIDYDHDGTVFATVMMSHELGHALADDMQRENHFSYRDNRSQMAEVQAYTVQHLVLNHLQRQGADPALAAAAKGLAQADDDRHRHDFKARLAAGDPKKTVHGRPTEYFLGKGLADTMTGMPPDQRRAVTADLMGANGGKDISHVLATAGIRDQAAMNTLADHAVSGAPTAIANPERLAGWRAKRQRPTPSTPAPSVPNRLMA